MSTRSIITLVAACWALVILGGVLTQLMLGRVGLAVGLAIAAWFFFHAGRISATPAKPIEPPQPLVGERRRIDVKG